MAFCRVINTCTYCFVLVCVQHAETCAKKRAFAETISFVFVSFEENCFEKLVVHMVYSEIASDDGFDIPKVAILMLQTGNSTESLRKNTATQKLVAE